LSYELPLIIDWGGFEASLIESEAWILIFPLTEVGGLVQGLYGLMGMFCGADMGWKG
jgi:hypothetical protein